MPEGITSLDNLTSVLSVSREIDRSLPDQIQKYHELFFRYSDIKNTEKEEPWRRSYHDMTRYDGFRIQDLSPDQIKDSKNRHNPSTLAAVIQTIPHENIRNLLGNDYDLYQKHKEALPILIRERLENYIRHDLDEVKNSALQSSDTRMQFWALGVPWKYAKNIESDDLSTRIPAFRFLLDQCVDEAILDVNSSYIERLLQSPALPKLVEALVGESPETNPYLFARACAAVRFTDLNVGTQKWFLDHGLIITDMPFKVLVRYRQNETSTPCNEIGRFLVSTEMKLDTGLIDGTFFPDNQHTKGSLMLVNYLNRFRIAAAATFITSKDQSSRGILIPVDFGHYYSLYLYGENSFQQSEGPHGSFVVLNSGAAPETTRAFDLVARYLRGEIVLDETDIEMRRGDVK